MPFFRALLIKADFAKARRAKERVKKLIASLLAVLGLGAASALAKDSPPFGGDVMQARVQILYCIVFATLWALLIRGISSQGIWVEP